MAMGACTCHCLLLKLIVKMSIGGYFLIIYYFGGGRASFDLRRKLSVETIVVCGRWGSVKSAQRYFQAGQAK